MCKISYTITMFDPLIPVMDDGFIGDSISSIWMEVVAASVNV